jgi:hypothetical protein
VNVTVPIFSKTLAVQRVNLLSGAFRQEYKKNHVCSILRKEINEI